MTDKNTAGIDLNSLTQRVEGIAQWLARAGKGNDAFDLHALINLARRAEPSVAADERALFETWYREDNPGAAPRGYSENLSKNDEGQYFIYPVPKLWAAWQARAALASPAVSRQAADERASYMRAIDSMYPIPNNPHQSVVQRSMDARIAFTHGWDAARAALASPAVSQKDGAAVDPGKEMISMTREQYQADRNECFRLGVIEGREAAATTASASEIPAKLIIAENGDRAWYPKLPDGEYLIVPMGHATAPSRDAAPLSAGGIDANKLEAMAKEMPDECFLKGSGVLKLIAAIRHLECAQRAAPDRDAAKLYGFDRESLEAIADGLEAGYEKGIDVGGSPLDGIETNIIESTTAAAARFIRAALARAPLPATAIAKVVETDIDISVIDAVLPIGTPLYAAPAQAGDVRNAALEEAAKICERQNDTDWPTPLGCAKMIRAAMSASQDTQGEKNV